MIEVELRYKVNDVEQFLAALLSEGITVASTKHIVNRWYIPESVTNRAEHDMWFDEDHGVAYRIRETDNENGGVQRVLDSKQHTEASSHNTFKEVVVLTGDEAPMLNYLAGKRYYNWLTIDKTRYMLESPNSELSLSIDTIAGIAEEVGIDSVFEIEYQGGANRDEALVLLAEFAATLGLGESDQFEKSLTVESMRALARFK